MKQTIALLTIAAALGLAGVAQAHGRRHHHHVAVVRPTALMLAQDAAIQYWDGVPCGGEVTITYAPQIATPANQTDGVIPSSLPLWAWVMFNTPTGQIDWTQPPSTFTSCVVYINKDIWTPATQAWDFSDFCGLIVHEYGHFLGHPDLATDSPTSITYPYIGPANEGVGPCVARYHLAKR